jgi:hypothetical protein
LPRLIRRCARATAIPLSPLSINSTLQPDIVLVRLASGGETNRRINEAAKLSKVSDHVHMCYLRTGSIGRTVLHLASIASDIKNGSIGFETDSAAGCDAYSTRTNTDRNEAVCRDDGLHENVFR